MNDFFWSLIGTIITLAAIAVLFLAMLWATAARGHDIYTNWAMPDQRAQNGKRAFSCCNNIDCAPRPSKWVNDHWEVFWIDGQRWIKVPDQKVEQNYPDEWDPGDRQSHACISRSGNVYCFRAGEWLQ